MLLSEILNIFAIYNNPSLSRLTLTGMSLLQNLENKFTIEKLQAFIVNGNFEQRVAKKPNAFLNEEEEIWLKTFLASRWNRVQKTNSCYSCNEDMPANKICNALAEELANTLHMNPVDLLKPIPKKTVRKKTESEPRSYDSSAELKFLDEILSDETGIKLFCAKAAHFKYLLRLEPENKKTCINALATSVIGIGSLLKSIESLNGDDLSAILSSEMGIVQFCSKAGHIRYLLPLELANKKSCFSSLLVSNVGMAYLFELTNSLSNDDKKIIDSIMVQIKSKYIKDEINEKQAQECSSIIDDESSQSDEAKQMTRQTIRSKKKGADHSKKSLKQKTKLHSTQDKQPDVEENKKRDRSDEVHPLLRQFLPKKAKLDVENQSNKINSNDLFNQNEENVSGAASFGMDEDDVPAYQFNLNNDIEQQFEMSEHKYNDNSDNEMIIEIKPQTNNNLTPVRIKQATTLSESLSSDGSTFERREKKNAQKLKITTKKSKYTEDDSSEDDDQQIKKKLGQAKKLLQTINTQFKKDELQAHSEYEKNHTQSIAAEKKAAESIQKTVMPLYQEILKYYSRSKSFENLLKFIDVSLYFINEYPVSTAIYQDEMAKIEKCLKYCNLIIDASSKASSAYKQEAQDFKREIENNYIVALKYNYAALNHRKAKIAIAKNTDDSDTINKFIKHLEADIKRLKQSIAEYQKPGLNYDVEDIIKTIKEYVAESYEDIGDFKNQLLDKQGNQNIDVKQLIQTLQDIKKQYQCSVEYSQNDEVLLSALTCQFRIIDLHLALVTTDGKNQALAELNNIIDVISKNDNLFSSVKVKIKLESISSMLCACSKAFNLTNEEHYKTRGLTYWNKNKNFVSSTKKEFDLQVMHKEIKDYLNDLNFIEDKAKLAPSIATHTLFKPKTITNQPAQQSSGQKIVTETKLAEPNTVYEYEAEDIVAILKARVHDFPNVYVTPVAQMNPKNQANGIADILETFIKKPRSDEKSLLLLPIQISGSWVGLSMNLARGKIITLNYYNALKAENAKVDDSRMQSIHKQLLDRGLIAQQVPIKSVDKVMQQCNDMCAGVLLIENFYCRLKKQYWNLDGKDINDRHIELMRRRHLDVLKKNDPGFYEQFVTRQASEQQQKSGKPGFFQNSNNTSEQPTEKRQLPLKKMFC